MGLPRVPEAACRSLAPPPTGANVVVVATTTIFGTGCHNHDKPRGQAAADGWGVSGVRGPSDTEGGGYCHQTDTEQRTGTGSVRVPGAGPRPSTTSWSTGEVGRRPT